MNNAPGCAGRQRSGCGLLLALGAARGRIAGTGAAAAGEFGHGTLVLGAAQLLARSLDEAAQEVRDEGADETDRLQALEGGLVGGGAGRRLKDSQVLAKAMELEIAKRTTTEMLRKGPTLPSSRPS